MNNRNTVTVYDSQKNGRSVAWVILAAALGSSVLGGCGNDFFPASYLNDFRVLSLTTTPLVAGPTDTVTVTPKLFLPAGQSIASQRITFCPFSTGSTSGFACAVKQCEVVLPQDARNEARADVFALAKDCLARFAASAKTKTASPLPSSLPDKVDMLFRYEATTTSGATRVAVARLPLFIAGVPADQRNSAPRIAEVRIDEKPIGAPPPVATADQELTVTVEIDPKSLDRYVDEAKREQTEEAIVSFYTTAGRFAYERLAGTTVKATWRAELLEPGQLQAEIYVVVRDLRGGQTAGGPYVISLDRSSR